VLIDNECEVEEGIFLPLKFSLHQTEEEPKEKLPLINHYIAMDKELLVLP
jgi:hypothetical protein